MLKAHNTLQSRSQKKYKKKMELLTSPFSPCTQYARFQCLPFIVANISDSIYFVNCIP